MRRRRWLVELPLGLVSLGLNRATHAWISKAVTARAKVVDQPSWTLMDGELLSSTMNLLAFSLRAPRWNPHAVIAFSPVLEVQEELSLDAEALRRASPRWTLVIYDRQGVAASLGATDDRDALPLPPGEYRVALRVYDPSPGGAIPQLEVDGAPALGAAPIPPGINEVYEDLRRRASLRHKVLQGYVFPMILLEDSLGQDRVEQHFLPVGNPETTFRYGVIERGQRLTVEPPPLPEGAAVYLCLYDRASFPMDYCRVPAEGVTTAPAVDDGTWLLRCVPSAAGAPDAARVRVQRLDRGAR